LCPLPLVLSLGTTGKSCLAKIYLPGCPRVFGTSGVLFCVCLSSPPVHAGTSWWGDWAAQGGRSDRSPRELLCLSRGANRLFEAEEGLTATVLCGDLPTS